MNPFLEQLPHNPRISTEVREEDDGPATKEWWWSRRLFDHRTVIVIIIYLSLLLDNVLLTVIVPILPDFLMNTSNSNGLLYKKYDFELMSNILANGSLGIPSDPAGQLESSVEDENMSIGVLLSTKAFVQLAFNPFIGAATKRIGYHWPILLGTMSLVFSSFLFAVGDNYYSMLFARGVQGIGSSCLGVCGMSLVACLYPEDDKRSKVMGVVLGSIALGVLIGYPVGGVLYDFVGKSSPFWIICTLFVVTVCLQMKFLNLNYADLTGPGVDESSSNEAGSNWTELLLDFEINLISFAIFISTSAMSILEPCLPLWLLTHLHPEKWQLGTVFIPDSLGYLIGTNGFGKLAYELGQIRVAVVALLVIGCSCIVIPGSTSMSSLMIPHFGLGLGIGVLDAALVPYLSSRIDSKYGHSSSGGGGCYSDCSSNDAFPSNYGTVYAIQQMAVSLAYSASPLLATSIFVSFPTLMFFIGLLNIIYAFVFYYFTVGAGQKTSFLIKERDHLLITSKQDERLDAGYYNRFYNSTN